MKTKKKFLNYSKNLVYVIGLNYYELISEGEGEELIHDLRVSIRRLNTVIDFLLFMENSKKVKKKLLSFKTVYKKLFKTLSAPRDNEVQIKLAENISPKFSEEHQTELIDYIRSLSKNSIKSSLDELSSYNILNVNNELMQFFNTLIIRKKILKKNIKRFEKNQNIKLKYLVKAMKKDIELFHKVRIQVKKNRYFLEFLSQICKKEIPKSILLKEIQDRLGHCNDMTILRNNISIFASDSLLLEITKRIDTELSEASIFIRKKRKIILNSHI